MEYEHRERSRAHPKTMISLCVQLGVPEAVFKSRLRPTEVCSCMFHSVATSSHLLHLQNELYTGTGGCFFIAKTRARYRPAKNDIPLLRMKSTLPSLKPTPHNRQP